jgi:catechol 2,3-dioxygenase-like lactoylglutathione lyase family enzyme
MNLSVGQVGIVVADLEKRLDSYVDLWPFGEWRCYLYAPGVVPEMTYRGKPGEYAMWVALSTTEPQLELIQPVRGESIYAEFLADRGEGIHHIAVYVESLKQTISDLAADGFSLLQSGHGYGLDGDGGYAYFDTSSELGVILEALERPKRRRTPDVVWSSEHRQRELLRVVAAERGMSMLGAQVYVSRSSSARRG